MSAEHTTGNGNGLHWFKSSHSGSGGGDCVEVAIAAEAVHVRDSKDTTRAGLRVSRASWSAFAAHLGG